jgi:outer membrane lipase/esterase
MILGVAMKFKLAVLAVGLFCASQAAADSFNQFISFGDSSIDSGWWSGALQGSCDGAAAPCATGNGFKDNRIANAIANGGTSAPVGVGLMGSQVLAADFGLTALPANQPGGTNYAISGAVNAATPTNGNIGNLNLNATLPSTVRQISNYLTSNGGTANSQALYLIGSGANDLTFARDNLPSLASREAYLASQAAALSNQILNLQLNGAQHILVHGLAGNGVLAMYYTNALFSDLAAAGVNFVGSDVNAFLQAILANPTLYGFTPGSVLPGEFGTGTASACVWTGGTTQTGWGQWCANTTTPSTQIRVPQVGRRTADELIFGRPAFLRGRRSAVGRI